LSKRKRFGKFFLVTIACKNKRIPVNERIRLLEYAFKLIRERYKLNTLEYVVTDKPYPHLHAVVYAPDYLPFGEIHDILQREVHRSINFDARLSFGQKGVHRAKKYVRRHEPYKPDNGHDNGRSDKLAADILSRIERLEKRIGELAERIESLYRRDNGGKPLTRNGGRIRNLPIQMRGIPSPGYPVIAIRFNRSVKRLSDGSYYVELTADEFHALLNTLDRLIRESENSRYNRRRIYPRADFGKK